MEVAVVDMVVVVVVVVSEKERVVAVRLIGSWVSVGGGGENGRSIELPP